MLIAQISDLHIKAAGQLAYGKVDTSAFLQRAIAHLNQMQPRPDLVIATGDLVDGGQVEEYENLRSQFAPLTIPLYLAVGNHDDRHALRQVFTDHAYLPADGFIHYVIEDYPVRLLVLDTLVPQQGYGLMDETRLAWLDHTLAQDLTRPTLVFMHHPPFYSKLNFMDGLMCRGGEAMAAVIARYPQVERVACGHIHRNIQTRWAGTVASVVPSVAHQVTLSLTPEQPIGFALEPPAFHLHIWSDLGGLVTHTISIGQFESYSYKTGERLT